MLGKNVLFPSVELFGETVKFKGYYCTEKIREICKDDCKEQLQVGLYINIDNICNADCKFCNIHNLQSNNIQFDLEKFENVYKELVNKDLLNRVAITGGEPFLKFELVNEVLDIIYKYSDNLIVTINTNATQHYKILELHHLDKIEGVNISRHHFDDELNNEIFACDTATKQELSEISSKVPPNIMRLKCNLIKGYVDRIDKMKQYLEFASDINALTVGFVTLREENDYCKEHKVEIRDLKKDKDVLKVEGNFDREYCECSNYIYRSNSLKFINVFDRHIKKSTTNYCFQLLYSNNELLTGFGKEKIV